MSATNRDIPGVEIESTYRVYVRQWLHVARGVDEAGVRDAMTILYEGRLPDEDTRVQRDPEAVHEPWVGQARLWTVWAEWKHEEQAEADRDALIDRGRAPEDVEVVARNSRDEHRLRQVGKVKMRKGTT